jgi:GNAT superfamily N-acetyltransferase
MAQETVQGTSITINTGYVPGILGRCVDMHMQYYSQSNGFGKTFELDLAASLESFLRRLEEPLSEAWSATVDSVIVGCIFIDGSQETVTTSNGEEPVAKLRAFIVDGDFQGQGIGKILMNKAIEFVDEKNCAETRLYTFKGLEVARSLYERAGFVMEWEKIGPRWGADVPVQLLVRKRHGSEQPSTGVNTE